MAMLMAARPRPKPEQIQTLLEPPPQATPAMGASPRDVEIRKLMARDLAKSAGDSSPVQHWLQGVNRVADGALGAFQDYTARQEEKKGKAGASAEWQRIAAITDPQQRTAAALAFAGNPLAEWASPAAQAATNSMVAQQFQPPTDDQREYKAAVDGGFKGSFMDYMTTLRQAGAMGQPTTTQKDYEYSKTDPGFAAYQKDLKPPRALPTGIQNAEDEDIGAVQTTQSLNAQLDTYDKLIADGKLELGPWTNLGSEARNWSGVSSPNSVQYATFKATLEKMRNQSLLLAKGVQTESDAARAWNELVANINDPVVVRAQIARIKELNTLSSAQKMQMINIRRQRNNMDAFDPAQIGMPPDIIGQSAGGAAPVGAAAPPPPGQFTPTDGAPPALAAMPNVPPDAIRDLKANPASAAQFDEIFGPGASQAILGGGSGGPEMAAPPGPMMAPQPAPDPYQLQDLTRRREEMVKRHRMLTRP